MALSAALALAGCSNEPFPSKIVRGNTYLTTVSVEPSSLDPSYAYDPHDDPIICQIYPSFFRFAYLKRNPYGVELDIGEKQPVVESLAVDDIQKDGSTKRVVGQRWTFTVRKDLRFQDDSCFPSGKGRSVTAADLIYAYKRMADPKVNCPIASYLADKIVGFKSYEDGFAKNGSKQYAQDIPGVSQVPGDPYTFSITLNQPYPQLKYIMAMHFTSPQAHEAVERYGDQYALHHPVGCGQFMLGEYHAHQAVILVRNPNAYIERFPTQADPNLSYMLSDAGKRIPFVDSIYIGVITEGTTSLNLFKQGYLDDLSVDKDADQVMTPSNGLNDEMKARGVQLQSHDNTSTYYIAFNMSDSVVGGYTPEKRKLRQAISLAIDSHTLIELNSGGIGTEAQWLIPPGLFGYDPGYRNPYRQYDPSLTKAKQLLAEAGYPNGIDPKTGQHLLVRYDCSVNSAVARESVRLVQKMIEALGIQVEIRATTYAQFDAKIRKHQDQIFSYDWEADYPDPENFLFLFYSLNAPPGPNHTGYHNPEYDRLFEQMRAMDDGPERLAIIKKMRDISVEDCPWVYTLHSSSRTLMQPWEHDFADHPMDNSESKYIRIDADLRRKLQRDWNHPIAWPAYTILALLIAGLLPGAHVIRTRIGRKLRKGGDGR